jgi:hypothetical protein
MLKTPKSQKLKRDKVHKVMGEYKRGKLKSGSGASVKSRSQAIAIAMKESGQSARMKRLKGKPL